MAHTQNSGKNPELEKRMKLTEDALSELGGFGYLLSLKLRILQRGFQVAHLWADRNLI
jgi:hypothetical protein